MPSVNATIEFLARLDKYKAEKPYVILLGEDDEVDDDDDVPTSNLQFETVPHIVVQDMREHAELKFEECGFEFVPHHESNIEKFDSTTDIDNYAAETRELLMKRFGAVQVCTYEVKLRQNVSFNRQVYDIDDPLVIEGPAMGAHSDVTPASAQNIIRRNMSKDDQFLYLQPDGQYRLRIINTWRPLNEVLEDRPLALCDSCSIEREDLEATDRVLPDRESEIYYLHHGPKQQWYWLEHQKTTEPFIFLMYDTMKGENMARVCPHVSFDNPRKSLNAGARSSVETRSIVVTKTI